VCSVQQGQSDRSRAAVVWPTTEVVAANYLPLRPAWNENLGVANIRRSQLDGITTEQRMRDIMEEVRAGRKIGLTMFAIERAPPREELIIYRRRCRWRGGVTTERISCKRVNSDEQTDTVRCVSRTFAEGQ